MSVNLNKLHRYVGVCIAPFLVIQTLSGLLLDFGIFGRGKMAQANLSAGTVHTKLDQFLAKIHFGPGLISDGYHLLLGAGIIWMAVSGWMLYLRSRRLRNKAAVLRGPGAAS